MSGALYSSYFQINGWTFLSESAEAKAAVSDVSDDLLPALPCPTGAQLSSKVGASNIQLANASSSLQLAK